MVNNVTIFVQNGTFVETTNSINHHHTMKKNYLIGLFFAAIGIATLESCYFDKADVLYPDANCMVTGITYTNFVAGIMNAQCATSGCHDAVRAASGADLSTYAATKSYATASQAAFLGSMRHSSGVSAMPKGAAKLPTCTLNKIEAWIVAGMPQ
jgi:hypothetical protein